MGGERASYGAQLLEQLGKQLSSEFGRGFESRNLRRMVKFAEAFPDAGIVSTLSTKLSWSHLVAIVALKSPNARQFYAQHAAMDAWSVRELNQQIERKAFVLGLDPEGKVIANLQDGSPGNYSPITTAREYGDWLYLGSLKNTSMARLPLKLALAQ